MIYLLFIPMLLNLQLHQNSGWIVPTRTIADTITTKALSIQEHRETEQ